MDPQDWDMDQLRQLALKYGVFNAYKLTKDELWAQVNDIVDPEDLGLEFYKWKRENLYTTPIKFSDLPVLSPTPGVEESYIRFSNIPILFPDRPEDIRLEEQKQALLSKEKLLEERGKVLKSAEQSVEERKAKVVSKERRIKIREKKRAGKIKQKEQLLAAQNKQVLLKQKQNKEKEDELSAREDAIEKLQEEAEQRNLELSEQKKQLDLKQKDLETLQRKDIIAKEELSSIERALELQKEVLEEKEQYLNEEEARILGKQRKIEDVYHDIYPFITVHNNCLVEEEAEIEEINFCTDKNCTRYTQADMPIEVRSQHQYHNIDGVKTVVCTTVKELEKNVENITLLQLVYHSPRTEETYEVEIEDFVVIVDNF